MSSEATIQRAILRMLDGEPATWYVKIHGSGLGRAGVPDLLVCHRGRFFALEVKGPRGKTTPRQDLELMRVRMAGGVAVVVRSVEDARDALREVAAAVG